MRNTEGFTSYALHSKPKCFMRRALRRPNTEPFPRNHFIARAQVRICKGLSAATEDDEADEANEATFAAGCAISGTLLDADDESDDDEEDEEEDVCEDEDPANGRPLGSKPFLCRSWRRNVDTPPPPTL